MDIRNIIDIITAKSAEVKANSPINLMESNPGATSDLVKSNAAFNAHAEETLNGMVDEFEVQTLDQFLRSKGVKPDYEKSGKDEDDEDLKEFWTNPPRKPPSSQDVRPGKYECTECWGDGTTFDVNDEIIVCPKCNGKGFIDTRRVAENQEEIDEAMKGVSTRKFSDAELTAYLDRTLAKDKTKQDKYKMPYVHRSNVIPIVDQEGNKYNLDALAKDITERPKKILKQNEKMQHSDGTTSIFYNVGLPALTGLGYDEEKKEFIIINTCPGAGECKTYCYAMKGGYVQWKSVSLSQTRMLNFLYNDPSGFMEQLSAEIDAEKRKADAKAEKTKVTIRWHDAGDFFSPEYLDLAYKLAATHPTVDFYAYTKIADVAGSTQNRPPNFMINFSMGARKAEQKRVDFGTTKHSTVVPRELFNDLIQKDGAKLVKDAKGRIQWNDEEDWDTFKQRLAAKYSIKPESIISYDEMMKKPLGGSHADGDRTFARDLWNVVVVPGDGDDSANRADVLGTYLLMH
jgi:DNA-directed RNA polymerase subunit RPC12/RpoP